LRKPNNTEKPKKKRKTENSAFADDDIYYLNYMHFSPLKLRNEDVNVHYYRQHCTQRKPPVFNLLIGQF